MDPDGDGVPVRDAGRVGVLEGVDGDVAGGACTLIGELVALTSPPGVGVSAADGIVQDADDVPEADGVVEPVLAPLDDGVDELLDDVDGESEDDDIVMGRRVGRDRST